MNSYNSKNKPVDKIKIEEILIRKRSIKQNENSLVTEDMLFNRSKKTYYKNVNVNFRQLSKMSSNQNIRRVRKNKEVSFCKNLVDYVDVISFKELNKENFQEPEIEVKTEDTPCEMRCKFIQSKCLIF